MLEQDEFELARAYFELKEMERCAWALRNSTSSRGRFLRVYASYLVSFMVQPALAAVYGMISGCLVLSSSNRPYETRNSVCVLTFSRLQIGNRKKLFPIS